MRHAPAARRGTGARDISTPTTPGGSAMRCSAGRTSCRERPVPAGSHHRRLHRGQRRLRPWSPRESGCFNRPPVRHTSGAKALACETPRISAPGAMAAAGGLRPGVAGPAARCRPSSAATTPRAARRRPDTGRRTPRAPHQLRQAIAIRPAVPTAYRMSTASESTPIRSTRRCGLKMRPATYTAVRRIPRPLR